MCLVSPTAKCEKLVLTVTQEGELCHRYNHKATVKPYLTELFLRGTFCWAGEGLLTFLFMVCSRSCPWQQILYCTLSVMPKGLFWYPLSLDSMNMARLSSNGNTEVLQVLSVVASRPNGTDFTSLESMTLFLFVCLSVVGDGVRETCQLAGSQIQGCNSGPSDYAVSMYWVEREDPVNTSLLLFHYLLLVTALFV